MQPSPSPAPTPPQAAHIDYWGALAPIEGQVLWMGRLLSVTFALCTEEQEEDLLAYIRDQPSEKERNLAEARYRMALAVQAVDGQEIRYARFADKLAWVRSWPMTLLDAVLAAYEVVAFEPIRLLEGMHADPNSASGPASSGASGAPPAVSATES